MTSGPVEPMLRNLGFSEKEAEEPEGPSSMYYIYSQKEDVWWENIIGQETVNGGNQWEGASMGGEYSSTYTFRWLRFWMVSLNL